MATKLITVKCPECGASLQIEKGRRIAYCTYCGAKVIIDNENEHIYRKIDEAEIKRAEADEKIRMREMDLEEKESATYKMLLKAWIISLAIFIFIGIIGAITDNENLALFLMLAMLEGMLGIIFLTEYREKSITKINKAKGKIKFSDQMWDCEGKNYHAVINLLRSAGFTNIEENNLGDLVLGKFAKPGTIESITIDGEKPEKDEWYYPDSLIMVNYHDFSSKK